MLYVIPVACCNPFIKKISFMLLPKNARQFFIHGPVGQLDCLELSPSTDNILGVALVFHPDPKGGGTYTNKIVQTIAKALNSKGYLCYCPNLRGVGLSDGAHDFGNAEIEDGLAVYEYAIKHSSNMPITLAGFSFGTRIASALANKILYDSLVLIGPAVTRYDVIVDNPGKTIVVHGDEDEVIPLVDVLQWSKIQNQPVISFPNSGHFFHGKLLQLNELLRRLI